MPINPTSLIGMIKNGKNPQQLAMSVLEEQAQDNPFMANLLNLAKQGRTYDIEAIAKNYMKECGFDYDKEFNSFKNTLGL